MPPRPISKAPAPMFAPPHPGELVAEVMEELGVPDTAAAEALGLSGAALRRLLARKVPVTPDLALRLGQWAGNGPEIWLRMQQAHDLWRANGA